MPSARSPHSVVFVGVCHKVRAPLSIPLTTANSHAERTRTNATPHIPALLDLSSLGDHAPCSRRLWYFRPTSAYSQGTDRTRSRASSRSPLLTLSPAALPISAAVERGRGRARLMRRVQSRVTARGNYRKRQGLRQELQELSSKLQLPLAVIATSRTMRASSPRFSLRPRS